MVSPSLVFLIYAPQIKDSRPVIFLPRSKTPAPFFVPVATRVNNVQFKRMVLPGETILLEVELVEQLSTAFFLKGRVTVAGKVAVRLDFACTLTEGEVR